MKTTTTQFAAWILDRARTSKSRLGRKVLLATLATESGLSRAKFNRLALEANQARLLTLARVDWVADGDYSMLAASEIEDRGSTFHAVVDESWDGF